MKLVAASINAAEAAALRLMGEGVKVGPWEVVISHYCPEDTVFFLNETEQLPAAPAREG